MNNVLTAVTEIEKIIIKQSRKQVQTVFWDIQVQLRKITDGHNKTIEDLDVEKVALERSISARDAIIAGKDAETKVLRELLERYLPPNEVEGVCERCFQHTKVKLKQEG